MTFIDKYLNRIYIHDNQEINLEFLESLVKAHLKHIPFENLDIHLKKSILLHIDYLSNKILDQKRGGYCFELNGLFQNFLVQLGYDAQLISVQVFSDENEYSPEFDHAAILVQIEEDSFLVDVGFGDFTQIPLNIGETNIQSDGSRKFQVRQDVEGFIVSELDNQKVKPLYRFKKIFRKLEEFELRNEFHQKSRDSHFHKKKIITRITDSGRITLTDDKLIIHKNGKKSEELIRQSDFKDYLFRHFKIKI